MALLSSVDARLRSLIAQVIGGVQPAGAESASGDISQVQKYDHNRLFGGTAPPGSASATGDVGQMLKLIAARSPNPYVPNFYDSWGFYAQQIQTNTGTGGTDPVLATPANLSAIGYTSALSGTGAAFTARTSPANGENIAVALQTGNASGNYSRLNGVNGLYQQLRYIVPGIPNYPSAIYTQGQWVIEARIQVTSITASDVFIGIIQGNVGDFTGGAGQYASGIVFAPANDATHFTPVNNNNGTVTYGTAGGSFAANTWATVRVVVDSTGVTCSVNGTAIAKYTTNFPGTSILAMFPMISYINREAVSGKVLYLSRVHDWIA